MSKMKNIDIEQYLNMPPEALIKLQKKRGWALCFIGYVFYGVLRLFGAKPNNYKGICPYFEIGKNWGGMELGWFFICGKNSSEQLKDHEVGHGIQNTAVGGLTMLCYSIGSAARYWWRRIFKSKTSYDSWFFEGDATKFGAEYVAKYGKEEN